MRSLLYCGNIGERLTEANASQEECHDAPSSTADVQADWDVSNHNLKQETVKFNIMFNNGISLEQFGKHKSRLFRFHLMHIIIIMGFLPALRFPPACSNRMAVHVPRDSVNEVWLQHSRVH